MRNIILSTIAFFAIISQVDTGDWWLGIAAIAVIINFVCQAKRDFDLKL